MHDSMERINFFSVRSVYNLILQSYSDSGAQEEISSSSKTTKFWRKLQNLRIAPKIRVFLQRLYNSILPTNSYLSKRTPSTSASCKICQNEGEDSIHVFFRCRLASETWLYTPYSHIRLPNSNMLALQSRFSLKKCSTNPRKAISKLPTFYGVLGTTKTHLFLRKKNITPMDIYFQAQALYSEYEQLPT